MLIRETLLELRNAVHTGNFTVLHALGSPAFQVANSPQRLGIAFADLSNPNIRLCRIAIVAPVMSEPPSITPENRLRLAGAFASDPLNIKFSSYLSWSMATGVCSPCRSIPRFHPLHWRLPPP